MGSWLVPTGLPLFSEWQLDLESNPDSPIGFSHVAVVVRVPDVRGSTRLVIEFLGAIVERAAPIMPIAGQDCSRKCSGTASTGGLSKPLQYSCSFGAGTDPQRVLADEELTTL
jgi:hypothetical protein